MAAEHSRYADLVDLFADWRDFEKPTMREGAPDYTAERFEKAYARLPEFRARLAAIDIADWPVEQQVDWHLVRAEINGFDFNHRVLKPWARDPAFYQSVWTYKSDVPAHEGPTHHAVLELWTYRFPLSDAEQRRMVADLEVIPPLMRQAQRNLTGNARDLWVAGIRNLEDQRVNLASIRERAGDIAGRELEDALAAAEAATDELVAWLEREAPGKSGPSGVGRDNYTWYQQNVHLVPLTWEDEVRLLRRELDRAVGLAETRRASQSRAAAARGGRRSGGLRPARRRSRRPSHRVPGRAGNRHRRRLFRARTP